MADRLSERTSSTLFYVLVVLCLAQVAWWIIFQFGESNRLEDAGAHLAAGDLGAAAEALGADADGHLTDAARSRRIMFASEGAALGLLVLFGVVVFYTASRRERRARISQQRFLAGATHELKTPVATVRLGLESLAQGTLPDDKRERYLRDMLGQVARLDGLLTNLLAAAGVEQVGAARQSIADLSADVAPIVDEFDALPNVASVRLTRREVVTVRRDPAAVGLIVRNLLDNAVKFARLETSPTIGVEVYRDGRHAVLAVTDDGVGISTDDLPHVFERCYRGAGRDHAGGTGLGLYLVDRLVREHGGRVTATSNGAGRGARFEVRLPLEKAREGVSS